MSATTIKPTPRDIEQARQEYLRDADSPSAENAPGGFACHELLDRTHLIVNQIEDWLLTHPACVHNAEWFALAYQALNSLQHLYQDIGASHLSSDLPEANGKTR